MKDEITNEPEIRFKGYTEDWEQRKVGEIFEKVSNKVKVEKKVFYKQIGIRSHGKGIFYKEEVTGEQLGNKSIFWVEPNVFIVNIVFAWEQAVTHTTENERGMVASHRFPMYRPIANILDLDYITMYFKTSRGKQLLESASPGGAGRNKTLGQKEFANLKISLPSVEEQQKIGSFFKQLDDTIALHQRKFDLLKQTKKTYLQKMFPKTGENKPEIRFAGFTDVWEQHKLGDYLSIPKKEKVNITDKSDLMTLKLNLGGISQGTNRETLELSSTIYYKRKAGQFLYGKQNFFNGSMAIIPEKLDGKATSGDVPSLDISNIDSDFLYTYVSRRDYWKRKEANASGTGSKRIHEKTLLEFDIEVPTIETQQKIGVFFKQIDKTITLHQLELDLLKEMKKTLLQKMFA